MTLAHRLRAQMRWRGIKSQNQLARISGVPQSSIHRILARGDAYSPARSTLQRLAVALNTSVPWLTDGVEPLARPSGAQARQPLPAAEPDGYAAELQALMDRLPTDARKKIVAIARLIADGPRLPPATKAHAVHPPAPERLR